MSVHSIPTYVDASVLINAAIGPNPARRLRAISVLGDRARYFVATRFLALEVIPLPTKYQRQRELNFYQRFLSQVTLWIDEEPLIQPAIDLASRHGLGALDALHLAAAMVNKAEFISAERPTKPLYQAYANAFSIY